MAESYVVLGAYGGIGEALTRRLARRGARTLVAGRDAGRLERLAAEVGGEVYTLDATQPEEVGACLRRAAQVFGASTASPTASAPSNSSPPTRSLTRNGTR